VFPPPHFENQSILLRIHFFAKPMVQCRGVSCDVKFFNLHTPKHTYMGRNLRAWFGLKGIISSSRLHIKSSPSTGAHGELSIVRHFSHPLESLWAHYHLTWYSDMSSSCQIAISMFSCVSGLGWMLLHFSPLILAVIASPGVLKPFMHNPIGHIVSTHTPQLHFRWLRWDLTGKIDHVVARSLMCTAHVRSLQPLPYTRT
jgi:hypothetical protein